MTVRTSGGDLDLNGYDAVVDDTLHRALPPNYTVEFPGLVAGTHTVRLASVADNCTVSGPVSQTVIVPAGRPVTTDFEIVCAPTGIAVTIHATGAGIQDTYDLELNGRSMGQVDSDSTLVVSRLEVGRYEVALKFRGENCAATGENPVAVDVSPRTVTAIVFEIACVAPVRPEKIAFTLDTVIDGHPATLIRTINIDGSGGASLVRGHSPAWSGDGSRLLFSDASCESDSYYGYVVCSGGLATIDPETGNTARVSGGNEGFHPSWSPSNDAIAFSRCCTGPGQLPTRLIVVRLEPPQTAAELHLPGRVLVDHPTWSPDGRRIAFSCLAQPGNYDLCAVDEDGSDFVRLTTDPASAFNPAWSPDGKQLAFATDSEIALLTLATGEITSLTTGRDPAWSPDGTKLVFAGDDGLFTINADGSNRTRLTTGPHHAPAWRP